MRSRLEGRAARYLEGAAWEYEPECYADETGEILPDFAVRLGSARILIVEVKGSLDELGHHETLEAMRPVWSSLPDAGLAIWTGAVLEEGAPFEIHRQGEPPVGRVLRSCAVCGRSLILDLRYEDTWTITCSRCEIAIA